MGRNAPELGWLGAGEATPQRPHKGVVGALGSNLQRREPPGRSHPRMPDSALNLGYYFNTKAAV
jgi:hypothetical protein